MKRTLAFLSVALCAAFATSAQAGLVYTIGAEAEVSGSGAVMPGDIELRFQNTATGVRLTIEPIDWSGPGYISGIFFYSVLDFADLTITYNPGASTLPAGPSEISDPPGNKFDGSGWDFDVMIAFPTRNRDRFIGGMVAVFDISASGGLSASNFVPPNEDLDAAGARVRGLENDGSGWFAIPEPSPLLLLGAGLLALFGISRQRPSA